MKLVSSCDCTSSSSLHMQCEYQQKQRVFYPTEYDSIRSSLHTHNQASTSDLPQRVGQYLGESIHKLLTIHDSVFVHIDLNHQR